MGCLIAPLAQGGEGGGSHSVPDTRNDFLTGAFGPSGVYIRNDTYFLDLDIDDHIARGRAVARSRGRG